MCALVTGVQTCALPIWGRPSSRVARLAAPTMVRVSTAESMKSSMSRGDMAENLHVGCAVAQESDDVVERHRGDRRQGQHQHAEWRVLDVIDGALDDADGDVEPARQLEIGRAHV